MNSEGIGLGLTISKRLVEANGGELKVQSDGVNQGAQFMFAMKMEQVVLNSHEPSAGGSELCLFPSKNILKIRSDRAAPSSNASQQKMQSIESSRDSQTLHLKVHTLHKPQASQNPLVVRVDSYVSS